MACHSCLKTGQYPSTGRGYSAPSPLGHRWVEWMGSWWVAFHRWRQFSRCPRVPPVRPVGLCRHSQKVGDRTREGRDDVDIIHQCLHCCTQCGPGQQFAKELVGILVNFPQEIDHEDGSNPVLKEPLVGVQCILQSQHPLHVGHPSPNKTSRRRT